MRLSSTFKRWWWLALPLGIFLAWASGILFDHLVHKRLLELGNRIAGEGYAFELGAAEPSFFAGSIILRDLHVIPDPALMDSLHDGRRGEILRISAETVELRQIGYWGLLTRDEVRLRTVLVERPQIFYHFRPADHEEDDPVDEVVDEEAMTEIPSLIRVDSVFIRNATGATVDITGQRPAFDLGRTDIGMYAVRLRTSATGRMTYEVGGADIHAWEISAELPPIYDLRVQGLHVEHPSGKAAIENIEFVSRVNEHEYWKELEFETDLFNVTADSVSFHRINVGRFLSDQVLHMSRLEVHSPRAVIHRDKSMPDAPFQHKSLPVSGLQNIGISIRIDTVVVSNGVVEYHERMDRASAYGEVSFSQINGTMTGLNNSMQAAEGEGELVVRATAMVYEKTSVELWYSAPLSSSHDAFMLHATLGELPFTMFNRMTDDLLNVTATAGSIHKMVLRMQGNEWQGSGTLDLHYEDLQIDLVPNSTKWHEGVFRNLLGNALVRRRNMPELRNYRQGEFVVDRRKDRAIFNFIWQGVKVGTVDTMAPGVLRKKMGQAVGASQTPEENDRKKAREERREQRRERREKRSQR
jgi:hypothetical protein